MVTTFSGRSSLTLTYFRISHSQRLSSFSIDAAENDLGLRSPRWARLSEVLDELQSDGLGRMSLTPMADQIYLTGHFLLLSRR